MKREILCKDRFEAKFVIKVFQKAILKGITKLKPFELVTLISKSNQLRLSLEEALVEYHYGRLKIYQKEEK